ncbi:IPT/TIG domain-containing protein [Mucilaginibacter sp. KACC 22773]|uniref:IPT/TIG domain-containing protein n=1 Tax=Mucilaginibacter sp. KACC 22773 TaxID=3025671 RepID=UPI002365682E|nr:IPT/TIG domain-containing protein [Mucilaginibacter sp. KACC 22773]WDF78060.1 IPT/TIG domain-containing protein [Mucilaginibacter sp. KACC 22773]
MKRFLLTCTLFLVACTVFAAAPIITSFSPVSGRAGTLVTISGSNLDSSTSVTVGGVAAIPISNTGSKLVAMVMPGATTGPVAITTSGGSTTGPGTFKVNAAAYPKYPIGGKLSGADAVNYAEFGDAVSLSADGSTAAIGGFNDNQIGGVWIFVRNGATWVQQGNKIVPSDYTGNSYIGSGVALSADGNTMIMGGDRGAWIYSRSNGIWTQQTNRLTGSDAVPNNDIFFDNIIGRGYTVSISADGMNVLISSAADANHQGAAWGYSKTGTTWTQQGGKITPSGSTGTKVAFGYSISMSADGLTAVIGSPGDDNSTGATYIFARTTGNWTQQGNKIIAADHVGPSSQGASVAVTANGNMIVVGGPGNANGTGATWVYTRAGNTWAQQAKLVSSGIISAQSDGLHQGYCVATNADGTVLLQSSPSENEAGAAWVYTRINASWTQVGKLPGSGGISQIGLALSADGSNALTGDIADNNIKGTVCAFSNLSFPVPTTGIASNITTTTATISGTVDDNGGSTAVNMEYSTSANMTGSIAAALTTGTTPIAAGSGNSTFTSKLTGLLPGTTYYYRINGTNATGANTGEVLSFLTLTPPVVSSFAPSASGVGTTIIITGVNLDNVTAVSIGGVAAASFARASSTTVYATVGAGATPGNVTVTNGYGTGSLAGFQLATAPKISYPTNPTYDITKKITPLPPTNAGGAVPSKEYLQVTTPAYQYLNGTTAAFYTPVSSTIDALGNIYVSDGSIVKKLNLNNQVSIYANFVNNAVNFDMYPAGLAVSPTGNIFVADQVNNRIIKITPQVNPYAEPFAGSGSKGSVNGTGTAASFNSPAGLVFDTKGNLYVAEQGNNLIRKITPAGLVSTFAGSGTAGAANGTGINASFNAPTALTMDGSGNIYVADKGNNMIRQITPAGLVTTLVGNGTAGMADGKGNAATFNGPAGVAADRNGNIYVADAANYLVRMITPAGIVTTLAGNGTSLAYDNTGTKAGFKRPVGVMCDLQGNLIISDSTNVRKMVITGYTSTPAMPPGLILNTANGTISGTPTAITNGSYTIKAVNVNGTGTTTIKITTVIPPVPPGIQAFTPYICKSGTKITITGINVLGATGVTIGGIPASSFTVVSASTITAEVPPGATSGSIVVSNQYGSTAVKGLVISNPPKIAYSTSTSYPVGTAIKPIIVKNSGGAVPNNIYLQATTLAGSGQPGLANGTDTTSSFNFPISTVADALGNVYVTEGNNNLIRKITPAGIVSTFAGSGEIGNTDGDGTAASFNYPYRLAVDAANNLYVSDGRDNGLIRKITPAGVVTTLARGVKGAGLTVAADGTVFVANERNSSIVRVTTTGAVSRYAGDVVDGSANGSIYGSSTPPSFYSPTGVAIDPSGNLYVSDADNFKIRKISSAGIVSDLAGSTNGYADGTGAAAKFSGLNAIAIDGIGNLYIADGANNAIRRVTPTGVVTTLVGNSIKGSINGIGNAIAVDYPQDISIDALGNIYMADLHAYKIRKITTTGYSVTPNLPAGLSIDGTGAITGVPTVITPETTYTVTAYNLSGGSSTTINFSTGAAKVPPAITSFSPASGPIGTVVTINGANLNYPTVKIGNVNALVVSNTGTELKCMVMPGAETGGLSVNTTAGLANSSGNFTVTTTPYPAVQQGKKLTSTNGSVGKAVAISADGNTILAALMPFNNSYGAVFFTRNNGIWTEQKVGLTGLDQAGPIPYSAIGNSVALSADGNTAAIGASQYSLNANSSQSDGAIWVFVKVNGVWKQQGLRLSGAGYAGVAQQGSSIAISADGNTIIEGAPNDDNDLGAAWIFSRTNGIWTQQGTKLVGTGSVGASQQGYAVNISADGNTAIVGGTYDNNTTGAAWIFTKTADNWVQQGTKLIKAGTGQGSSVALSADGNTAIVGETGGANIFVRTGTTWNLQGAELIGTGFYSIVYQGRSVALSADGNTATMAGLTSGYTVDANQSLLWVFTRTGNTWKSATTLGGNDFVNPNDNTDNNFFTAITPDGKTAVMNTDFQGALWVFVAATPASATTRAATAVGGTTATLNGVVNDGGQRTTVTIEYGTSPTLAGAKTATLTTGVSPILPATGNVSFTSNLTNLIQGTTYYFRIKCISGSTTLSGDILSFTTIPSPPTITSFTPPSTITGTEITITGTNFITVTDVSFGGTPATSFNVVSPTMITAIVGEGTSGKVAVTTTGGTATLAGFNWVFTLPANNFTITANSASCRGSANGSITIAAAQQLNYTVTLTGGNMNKAYSFTDVATISNLAAGTYNLCFKVAGQSSYSQCFDIVITEPKDLAMYAAINKNASNITLTLDGASTYYITLNGTTVTTTQNIITLALNKGSNDIAISSDKPCQGSLEKKFTFADDFSVFPNPFNTTLNINVGTDNLAKATLQLYNIMGTKVYSQQFSNISGIISINPGNLVQGTYMLKLLTGQTEKMIKVVKQ